MRRLERILFVEDDPDIRTVGLLTLEKVGGFEVKACANGLEAMKVAPDFAADLVLLDMMMPKMDGIETFKNLRFLPGYQATPIVFMTAKVQAAEREQYFAIGAAEVIAKPFHAMELPQILKNIWERNQPK